MSKTSRNQQHSKAIPIPKNLLIYQKPVSPSMRRAEHKSVSNSRCSNEAKSNVSSVKRGKTLTGDNFNTLQAVERNHVRELYFSPTKYRSKSPIQAKAGNINPSPCKGNQLNNKFERLRVSDFLNGEGKLRKSKVSIIPGPLFVKCKH